MEVGDYIKRSKNPFTVDSSKGLAGQIVFRGTSRRNAESIAEAGINEELFIDGLSGKALHVTTDIEMALNQAYGTEDPTVVMLELKTPLLTEKDERFGDLTEQIKKEDASEVLRRHGLHGMFNKWFNEVALYDSGSLEFIDYIRVEEILQYEKSHGNTLCTE